MIAIISLLVSILLPTLSRAKELARDVLCRSNLHSMGLAVAFYAEDSDRHIPPASLATRYADYYDLTFDVLLDAYLNTLQPGFPDPYVGTCDPSVSPGMWHCPADNVPRDEGYHTRGNRNPRSKMARSYTMNLLVAGHIYIGDGQSAKLDDLPPGIALMGDHWGITNFVRELNACAFVWDNHIMNPDSSVPAHLGTVVNMLFSDGSVEGYPRNPAYGYLGGDQWYYN